MERLLFHAKPAAKQRRNAMQVTGCRLQGCDPLGLTLLPSGADRYIFKFYIPTFSHFHILLHSLSPELKPQAPFFIPAIGELQQVKMLVFEQGVIAQVYIDQVLSHVYGNSVP